MEYHVKEIPGFWDRVNIVIGRMDIPAYVLARRIGVSRCYFTRTYKLKSMGSGVLMRFCRETGASADWLLGLKEEE